jgi:hypothetical protein
MRKILFVLVFLALLLSACAPNIPWLALPTVTATTTALPTTCQVWQIKSWYEMGWALDGSFSQIPASDGGINTKLLMSLNEINFTKSLNPGWDVGTGIGSWPWAADAPKGKYYQSVTGVSINTQVWWNWVAQPSPDQRIYPGVRNVMCVSKIVSGYAYVVAAPKGLDYSKYQLDWLVQPVYGNWESQNSAGEWTGMPHIWTAYMFDPASGFTISASSDKAFRFPSAWLYKYIRTDVIPWRVPQTSTATISSPTNTPNPATPTFTPSATFTPSLTPSVTLPPTATRTPECHLVPFANIDKVITVCVP